ncbi:hypothetical protein ELI_0556 [Eubacterium callanderi]|uniref:Uncharacterized protein n=2 Tax=Eubacterium callanderi TaxID=53442 RepID=E3GIT7_9FIRM|nr:hypothetical protein ELI_0556 [Eubacterium callanderi]
MISMEIFEGFQPAHHLFLISDHKKLKEASKFDFGEICMQMSEPARCQRGGKQAMIEP